MLRVVHTKQFERDIKLNQRRHKDMDKIKMLMTKIANQEPLEIKFRNHKLSGNYVDRWECHIESDWLLIYKVASEEVIFERTGTHADLFE